MPEAEDVIALDIPVSLGAVALESIANEVPRYTRKELIELDAASRGLTCAEAGAERWVGYQTSRFHRNKIQKKNPGKMLAGIVYDALLSGDIGFQSDGPYGINPNLTPRQLEVIGLICDGKTNAEIANILNINITTVKSHTKNIRFNLDAKNSPHITRRMFETGEYKFEPPKPGDS